MDARKQAVANIKARTIAWNKKYHSDGRGALDPYDITIGEVENELLRMKGLPECPMYERDYSGGWR